MPLLIAIDTLDDLAHNAKTIPLTGQVRVPAGELVRHAEAVRTALPPELATDAEAHALLDRLDAVERGAKPVPMTDQVRFDKDELYAVLDGLRALVAPR